MTQNKREDATELVEMIKMIVRLPADTKERLYYMIEGAALVSAAQDKDAS